MVEWLSPVLYTKVTALFWAGFTLLPKPKHEKKHGTINWKFSNARKTQNFTCWALTKIRPYCLRTLKPTAYRICWKLWMSRFALRKKKGKFGKQTSKHEIWQFRISNCQLAQLQKVFTGLLHKKRTEVRGIKHSKNMRELSKERMKEQDTP